MAEQNRRWMRQGEAFWRAHHEAWKRSDLNQRQYCECHGLPQKAFENWRQKFKAEPEPSQRKLLYRRSQLSPPLSPPISPPSKPGGLIPPRGRNAYCSAAARGASTPVQRSRQGLDPRRGSATRRERRQRRASLRDRSSRAASMEAGVSSAGLRHGADHRCDHSECW